MGAVTLVYVTAANQEEASKIAKVVVGERLAACANVYPQIRSFYWWEGRINEDLEAVLILKTSEKLVGKLMARIKEIHSYDCPCILTIPVQEGFQPFCDWILQETEGQAG